MPGLIYAKDAHDAVYVNLYIASGASFAVGGQQLRLALESEMPWGGASRLTVSTAGPVRASIKLRIPGWARERPVPSSLYAYTDRRESPVAIDVNGARVSAAPDAMGYVSLDREWKNGDVVRVVLPVEIRRVVADQRVTSRSPPRRNRTRPDRLLRGVAGRRRRPGSGSADRSRRDD